MSAENKSDDLASVNEAKVAIGASILGLPVDLAREITKAVGTDGASFFGHSTLSLSLGTLLCRGEYFKRTIGDRDGWLAEPWFISIPSNRSVSYFIPLWCYTYDQKEALTNLISHYKELNPGSPNWPVYVRPSDESEDPEDYEDEVCLKAEVERLKGELQSANERLDRFRDEYSKLNQKLERKSEALRECLAVSKIILDGFSDPKFSLSVAHLKGLVSAENNPDL